MNTISLFNMIPSARCVKIVRSLPCPCPGPLARWLHLPNREQYYRQRGCMIGPGTQAQMLDPLPCSLIDLSHISPAIFGSLVLTSGRFASAKPNQGWKDVRVIVAAVSCARIWTKWAVYMYSDESKYLFCLASGYGYFNLEVEFLVKFRVLHSPI